MAPGGAVAPAAWGPEPAVAPMWLSERPRRGRIGGVAVGQLVAVQVAALAAVATFAQSDWIFVPVVLAAAAAVGAAFARRDGHWWYEHALLRWRFSRRRAARRAAAARGQVAPLAPGLSVQEVADRGASFGVGLDEEGWYAAVAVLPGPGPRGSHDLSVLRLARLLQPVDLPVTTIQIGQHRPVAAPAGWPAGVVAPEPEQVWVALRLDAGAAPAVAADRGGGLDGVHRALAAALRRVIKVLRTAGLDGQALDAHGLANALVEVTGGTGAAEPPVEQWRVWRVGGTAHVCFQMHGQLGAELVEVAARSGQPPVESYTVTVALRVAPLRVGPPGAAGELPLLTGVLRVAAPVVALDQAVARAAELAAWAGMRLRRLDGEHGLAVYAIAPTGKDASALRAGSSHAPRRVTGSPSRPGRTHRRPRRPAAPPPR
jgi:type VII secretion protein EccE